LVCGIIGIAAMNPLARADWLEAGRDAMCHRGPDGQGLWWAADRRVALAHRRLAIIDLSPAGAQPMTDRDDGYCIVLNGEIYNYRELRAELEGLGAQFRSQGDTEVVLHAYRRWGDNCLARLQGMFALAICDQSRSRLLLARDCAGEKPLFYRLEGGELRFASELKGLLADPSLPRRFDATALDCYLAAGFAPGAYCLLAGFRKLPPGHALAFDFERGTGDIRRYWRLPHFEDHGTADEDLLDELETSLEDAVGRQLVADVPVGVLLSGGVDSSLITAMAARRTERVRTFTIRFPGHGRYDETEHARLIARHFDTEHVELEAEPSAAALMLRLARQYDEPIIDSSMIPTFLVSQLVAGHCKVALGGDGGDELFGGYNHYSRFAWLESRFGRIPRAPRAFVAAVAEGLLPVGVRGRNWLQALGTDLAHGVPFIARYFDPRARRRLLAPVAGRWPCSAEAILAGRTPSPGDLIERATRRDFVNYLPEDILVKVDRASMANSLELRAPLLDRTVIEFAYGRVPARLKATATGRKILLKRLAARLLPSDFDLSRKQGFTIPLGDWLRAGPFRSLCEDVLLDPKTMFARAEVRRLLAGQDRGRNNGERLFGLLLLEMWRREYGVQEPGD
jgi:asparagine synthase (glutamine-hydrolysing)